MDQAFWLERERNFIAHVRAATLTDVRPMHYDLATGYSLKAAASGKVHLSLHGRTEEMVK